MEYRLVLKIRNKKTGQVQERFFKTAKEALLWVGGFVSALHLRSGRTNSYYWGGILFDDIFISYCDVGRFSLTWSVKE